MQRCTVGQSSVLAMPSPSPSPSVRVLALTSLPAFVPQVISCAASDAQDVVLKKSLYLYITTWATANPELMLLTINMLLKDCGDQDPTIRGLALRSLCSLRISNLTEYLVRRD